MYKAKNTKTGEIYKAQNIKELSDKSPNSITGGYTPSSKIKWLVREGKVEVLSGPDWFMALANEFGADAKETAEAEAEQSLEAEEQTGTFEDAKNELEKEYAEKMNVTLAELKKTVQREYSTFLTRTSQFAAGRNAELLNELMDATDELYKRMR